MTIKHFFEVYPPKRMWRKLWIGLSSLPMLPQHRSILLKWGDCLKSKSTPSED
jgi:hypothetical protein